MSSIERPTAAALLHLRPTDARGGLLVGASLAATAGAIALSTSDGWMPWLIGQLALAALLVQWFVVLHECGHDTMFRTRRLNAAAGWIASVFAFIPYRAWTRVHGRHHKWTGWQDLDPTTESLVPRPLGRTERAIVNVCWRLWIPIFSVLYRVTNYWHVPRLLRLFPAAAERRLIVRDAALLVLLYTTLLWTLGFDAVGLFALPIVLSLLVEDLLLLSQHTHVPQNVSHGEPVRPFPALDQEVFTRSIRFPAVVSAFVLHFDAHELHHMYPFVPGYHLRRVAYAPVNEISWWHWVRGAKRLRGDVLLFQNRLDTGYDL